MGIWVELGIFGLALAFGLWQLYDVKQAREETRRRKEQALEQEREQAKAQAQRPPQAGAGGPTDPPPG